MARTSRVSIAVLAVFILSCIPAEVAFSQTERTQSVPTGYWWFYGQTPAQVSQILSQNNARIVDLQVESVSSSGPIFTVSMVSNTGAYAQQWWWWYGQSASDVTQKLSNLN